MTPRGYGAHPEPGGTRFRVFAPKRDRIDVVIEPQRRTVSLARAGDDFEGFAPGVEAGARYWLQVDGGALLPDPASRFQPEGVHGPSEVVDAARFAFRTDWAGRARSELIFYELHVGTFSTRGDYEGVRQRLGELADLGVTAIELMPLHDFPGERGWGYDPAAMFAPARAYGRPEDLARLVDEAHALGMAMILDVVHNHFGPDGAYAVVVAPELLSPARHTPWGSGINLDGEHSAGVRRFFLDNARMWLEDYRFDGLRLDSTFALVDEGPLHFLSELTDEVATLAGPPRLLFAEDHRNERLLLEPRDESGHGLTGMWSDDFHHQLHRLITGEPHGYYADFSGGEEGARELARCINDGWIHRGAVSPYYGVSRGSSPHGIARDRLVFCAQNHDQIGNRTSGDRLHTLIDPALLRAATCLLFVAPELPLLFMGQEWAASSPFLFFTDHRADLGRAIASGRRRELERFEGRPVDPPDPQSPDTFLRSRLDWTERAQNGHGRALALHRDLIALRKALPPGAEASSAGEGGLIVRRGAELWLIAFRCGMTMPIPQGAEVAWHTEQTAYASEPQPPVISAEGLRFFRPGAARVRVPAA